MGKGDGMGGGCPSPSIQKPIPSPRAEIQGPLKIFGQKRGKGIFLKKYISFFDFCTERLDPYLIKKASCFVKIQVSSYKNLVARQGVLHTQYKNNVHFKKIFFGEDLLHFGNFACFSTINMVGRIRQNEGYSPGKKFATK